MNYSRQTSYSFALSTLLWALGLAMVSPAVGLATDLPLYGAKDGDYFREVCPKGSYLVGVDGKYGGWVNRVAPVCAPWLSAQKTFGPPTVGPHHGGRGGDKEKQRLCWGFGINNRAVQAWQVWVNRSADRYVNSIYAKCAALAPPIASGKWGFGILPDLPRTEVDVLGFPIAGYDYPTVLVSEPQVCPPGELGVGLHGLAGDTVQALGLICGPLPLALVPPATKVNPLAKAPERAATKANPLAGLPIIRDDMFTILKPDFRGLDRVAQGQLVLLVKPPKIGTPAVTVLEFKWLNAPDPKQCCYSIAVNTQDLLKDYLVPQQSTPRNPGDWEVRARAAAQPTPGPPSLATKFTIVVIQPVQSQTQSSPIQQTSPLPPSSVTQAPATSGATTQMKRSSSMIVPRGVEEKAGEAPAEPETKP